MIKKMASQTISPNQRASANKITRRIVVALDKLGGDLAEVTMLIKEAYDQEVWTALGETREEWIQNNFANVLGHYSTDLRRQLGAALKSEVPALTTRDAAKITGVSQATAARDLNQVTREKHGTRERNRKPKDDQVIEGEVTATKICNNGCPVHCPE